MFPGKESVANCQSELPKLSESYNSHLLKPVKLTIVTCLYLVKGHKQTFFHLSEVKKSDQEIYWLFCWYKDLISWLMKPEKLLQASPEMCHLIWVKFKNLYNIVFTYSQQARENEKNSGGTTNYVILPATMVGRLRKFFISNSLKRLEKLVGER